MIEKVFAKALKNEGPDDITLMISTAGGNYGVDIYDLLNLYPGKINGLVVGRAQSAGAIILQACDVRYATPNSLILIHHGCTNEVRYDSFADEDSLETFVSYSKRSLQKRYDIFMTRTGRTRDEIRKKCLEDQNMFPEEAIQFGLLDKIWRAPLPIKAEGLIWPKDEK